LGHPPRIDLFPAVGHSLPGWLLQWYKSIKNVNWHPLCYTLSAGDNFYYAMNSAVIILSCALICTLVTVMIIDKLLHHCLVCKCMNQYITPLFASVNKITRVYRNVTTTVQKILLQVGHFTTTFCVP
jgi:hypothetical protein